MLTIDREELKQRYPDLIKYIQANHVVEPEVEQELYVNHKPVKGLCHQRGYFVIWGDFYFQYLMDHIIMNVELRLIGRSVQQVIFYDDYIQYETERTKAMSAVKDQTGLNLN